MPGLTNEPNGRINLQYLMTSGKKRFYNRHLFKRILILQVTG